MRRERRHHRVQAEAQLRIDENRCRPNPGDWKRPVWGQARSLDATTTKSA